MNLSRKKIIAKEFLIILSCLIILPCIVFVGTYFYDFKIKSDLNKLRELKTNIYNEIQSLQQQSLQINHKISEQKKFYSKIKENGTYERSYKSFQDELWKHFESLRKSDSIIFKWNNVWNDSLIEQLKNLGYTNPEEFNMFIFENTLDSIELYAIEKINTNKIKISIIINEIKYKESKLFDNNRRIRYMLLTMLFTIIIAYPFRFIVLSIIWSFKTLKL